MHKTRLPSFTLHHTSDFSGVFCLVDRERFGILASRDMLEVAVRGESADFVLISGPDSALHARHAVTAAPAHATIAPGNWTLRTLRLARRDIENVLVLARTAQLVALAERITMGTHGYRDTAAQLDAVAASLEPLAAQSLPLRP
jgi:dihydroxyacid dehydratase/phosphogluconate dehydratase